jgi:hypothetical protein
MARRILSFRKPKLKPQIAETPETIANSHPMASIQFAELTDELVFSAFS